MVVKFIVLQLLIAVLLSTFAYSSAVGFAIFPGISTINTNLADYPNRKIPQYHKFELSFVSNSIYANPYDPNEIRVDGYFTLPNSKTIVQPGFYYQNYEVQKADGIETYTPEGKPFWKIRFTPVEVGTYLYEIKITDKNGTSNVVQGSFDVVRSNKKGFIHISQTNQRYFEYANGASFWGIGLNIAWWQDEAKRISFYQTYLEQMKENRMNLARVWMTNSGRDQNWILSIQDKTLGSNYNLEEAWAFDQILDLAQQNDIYFLLTLDDVNQYTYNWKDNLYNRENGGSCQYRSCIFTHSEAKKYQQRLFRYIIARWGYSPSIFSWELFNEIDELQWSDILHWNRGKMIQWHQEMVQYIRSIDAHRHLTNTSTGSFKTHPDLYELPEMDFAQIHFYYVPGCCDFALSDPEGRDITALTHYYSHQVNKSVTNKPSIIGEWGLLGENWAPSPDLARDDSGVHIHNGLWASLMSGLAVSGLSWEWQDHQLQHPSWWRHYHGIANYFADIQTSELTVMAGLNVDIHQDERQAEFSSSNDRLRALGLRNETSVYAWIQNKEHTWWNAVNEIQPKPQSGILKIYNMLPKKSYTVEWWDPYRTAHQVILFQSLTTQADGSLRIEIKNLTTDIAIKVYPSINTFLLDPI